MVCQHRRGREGTNRVYDTAVSPHTQPQDAPRVAVMDAPVDLPPDAGVSVDQLIIQLHRAGHHRPSNLVQQHGPQVVAQALAELAHQPPTMDNHGGWLTWRCRKLTEAAQRELVTPEPERREFPRTDNTPPAEWPTAGDIVRRKAARS